MFYCVVFMYEFDSEDWVRLPEWYGFFYSGNTQQCYS